MPSDVLCRWHDNGVPVWGQGRAFFEPGCPRCGAKRTEGKVSETDPRPTTMTVARKKELTRRSIAMARRAKKAQLAKALAAASCPPRRFGSAA